jgi:hypothetical protein
VQEHDRESGGGLAAGRLTGGWALFDHLHGTAGEVEDATPAHGHLGSLRFLIEDDRVHREQDRQRDHGADQDLPAASHAGD